MAHATVVEFTDPGCPWAWSAEPARRRVQWLYGDALDWQVRMIGLAATREAYAEKGFTPEAQQRGSRALRERYGMPIDDTLRPAVAATLPACRAVVGARLHAPDRTRPLLRALRLQGFGGAMLDEEATLLTAAAEAGVAEDDLRAWLADDAVEAALREDMDAARRPLPAALVLRHKLARDGEGWRYTCPSLELSAGGTTLVAPGFQPIESYEVALANLLPGLERREQPQAVEEVLRWAGEEPLATRELAVVTGLPEDDVREQAALVAESRLLGQSEVWSLR